MRSPMMLAVALLACVCQPAPAGDRPALQLQPADVRPSAATSMMLAAARAGRRIVAVGERGTILWSDDDGASFRQADAVPVSSTLTDVSFADAQHGWAVGHAGVVLHTADAGRTWALQRSDPARDQPLWAVHFSDASHGVAVGLWSLVLVTQDGGREWQPAALPAAAGGRGTDVNLYGLFAARDGALFACAEQGRVFRSADGGRSWQMLETGYRGSLWAGLALADGTLLIGGLRGTLLRSRDGGTSWTPLETGVRSSITGLTQLPDGRVLASALDGVVLVSTDGVSFKALQSVDRLAYTA
ncbi:MAG TPA: YCF48-related protein, partial [Burkholderiaceae bacterium]|nr:YCF48-related protein [Burkholderiaceae bacterium]